ncbi:MAG: 30S ribosomal protein S16 [Candidatus Izemoplasmatales bacterium]|uniref:Small ribosomal subunit protein bS16 n=1 Tax=Hujiaoplasma nucleasis TaxID=2725268 RepID=A0A7L6N4E4_9MOLU|nr:30S ribosomal protein S16 [Hujiaoplasma nucleasis]QLY40118.1 30S ribosomal protein S16 [Hujiaoplasma nucleasis]
MVKLRLQRFGTKKRPFYRVVAADSRKKRDGRYLEIVGTYDPTTQPALVEIDNELAKKWLHLGAQPTDTVKSLFTKAGVMSEFLSEKNHK